MIYEILRNGEEEAISNAELSNRLGVDGRTIRKYVHDERRAGLPILSGVRGYYLPDKDPEIAKHQLIAFQRQQRGHVLSHSRTAGIASNELKKIYYEERKANE